MPTQVLEALEPGTVYVIGALIDRSVQSGASLERAAAGGCCTRRLPLREHLPPRLLRDVKSALNINAVLHVLIEWSHCRSWEAALLSVLGQSQRVAAPSPAAPHTAAETGEQETRRDVTETLRVAHLGLCS